MQFLLQKIFVCEIMIVVLLYFSLCRCCAFQKNSLHFDVDFPYVVTSNDLQMLGLFRSAKG